MITISAISALFLALVHFFASRLWSFEPRPRSRWLSIAGGVSISYVFIHLLPELSESQKVMEHLLIPDALAFLELHAYLLALAGLLFFYGMEKTAKAHTARRKAGAQHPGGGFLFWLHMAAFTVYNIMIGYLLLHGEDATLQSLLLYLIAMGLHFFVNDHSLLQHHQDIYDRKGRWVLAAAPLVGWAIGLVLKLDEAALVLVFAFLAGSLILNVLKEELTEESESSFWAFAVGTLGYSAILIAL